MRFVSKLARFSVTVVIALPILFLAVLGGARFAGYGTQVIATGSMTPDVARGSVVLVKPLAADRIRVGDIVLVPRPPHGGKAVAPVMHRVVSVTRTDGVTTVETKGDANKAPDPDAYVVGPHTMTPVLVVPMLGFLFEALRTPQGWFLLAVLPVLLRTVVVVRRVWRESDDDPQLAPSPTFALDG